MYNVSSPKIIPLRIHYDLVFLHQFLQLVSESSLRRSPFLNLLHNDHDTHLFHDKYCVLRELWNVWIGHGISHRLVCLVMIGNFFHGRPQGVATRGIPRPAPSMKHGDEHVRESLGRPPL